MLQLPKSLNRNFKNLFAQAASYKASFLIVCEKQEIHLKFPLDSGYQDAYINPPCNNLLFLELSMKQTIYRPHFGRPKK